MQAFMTHSRTNQLGLATCHPLPLTGPGVSAVEREEAGTRSMSRLSNHPLKREDTGKSHHFVGDKNHFLWAV